MINTTMASGNPSVSLRRFPIHDDAHGAFMTRSCHTIGVSVNTPSPADLCMQSVMKRDAAMGWQQLYSSVHSQVPLSVLVGQVEKQRIAEAGAIVKKIRHRPDEDIGFVDIATPGGCRRANRKASI